MVTNITETPLRLYDLIPRNWKRNTPNYDKAAREVHFSDGWREVEQPRDLDPANFKEGVLLYDEENDRAYIELLELSESEKRAYKLKGTTIITPAQGRLALAAAGLLPAVLAAIPEDELNPLRIYWEYAVSWDRFSPYVTGLAQSIGLTEEQLDNFFIEASKIQ